MRNRYQTRQQDAAYFVTSTIQWLPVFTTAAHCDLHAETHPGIQTLPPHFPRPNLRP